ncbi:MAG TPA: YicC/YloC family endoribonuclease [Nevskiaceae bacterium]
MTGYARVERAVDEGALEWELRAVNHRYLDLQLRLPEEFRALEPELRSAARDRLRRGKVEATLRCVRGAEGEAALRVDASRLAAVQEAMHSVTATIRVREPTALDVLRWPGVVREPAFDVAAVGAAATRLFDRGLEALVQMRQREGERLAAFLTQRLDAIDALVARQRKRAPEVREAWRQRLRSRIAELGVEVDPVRLAQEEVIAAQRLDVDEELSRLDGHVREVRAVMERPEAVGRRLDFLMQELNREANTLSSKSQDAEMTRDAVELKVLIEQLREQVQNVE